MNAIQFNPFSPESLANPYPQYKLLRDSAPVFNSPLLDLWVLSRYEDVNFVLKDDRFSADSTWVAFAIGMPEEDREKLREANKPVRNKMALRNLVTGETEEMEDVASYVFSDDGRHLAMRRYPIAGRESSGVDLVVRELATATDTNFGNVADSAWADDRSLLAMTIDAEGQAGYVNAQLRLQ